MKKIFIIIIVLLQIKYTNAQNVGIGQATPLQKLHIGGTSSTIRVDGLAAGGGFVSTPDQTGNLVFADTLGDLHKMPNGSAGQIPKINNTGTITWTNPPVRYFAKGTFPAAIQSTVSTALMPEMTISFVPKNSNVQVLFFGMGKSNVYETPIQFSLRVNGIPVINWKASAEASMANEWVSSMSFPVTVIPGQNTVIEVFWGGLYSTFGSYQITSSAPSPIARSLTILDM